MSKVIGTDTREDVFVKLSEGNPGALRVCLEIYTQDSKIDPIGTTPGLRPLLRLDDMGIYGSDIWVLYKNVCDHSIVHLLALLRANQLGHVGDSQIKLAINGQHSFDLEIILENVKAKVPDFATQE